ncbi:MAG: hypothetical protein CVV30_03165 [Methanomicrobiales archaeon HGW-Methanomicrobiales-1]|nr:MAG: hypothetical protein CVV30_03165 [Methanomicrobiales archaeon HGW-Methanomicrobiales-1]
MSCRAGFVWGTPQHFNRYIEDCGIACELVTPYMLAAPFYRGTFNCLIIPTGFANHLYSNLLPALRASSPRIKKFVENGGNLLVFGASTEKADVYDWLPFSVTYQHDCHPRRIDCSESSDTTSLIEDYDPDCIECDGSFLSHDGICVGKAESADVIIEKQVGKGKIVITSVHEYPSRNFLKKFCCEGSQTNL